MIVETYLAIFLFLIICILLGITLNFFFKFTDNFESKLYKLLSLVSIGFGTYFILIFVLGFFRIPLAIWLFLIISLIVPTYILIKSKGFNIKHYFDSPSVNQIILLAILIVFFILMLKGTFSYNWLEDDDPWNYAMGAKYVSINKDYHTYDNSVAGTYYLFPNSPPGLSSMLGLLHQITPDLYSIMKIFINLALLIGVISFFLFCYIFSEKSQKFSLIATFILIITPCFAGHFIFNYTLSVVIFLVFLFALSLAFLNFKNILLAGLMCGAVIIAHPITAIQTAIIMFLLFSVYFMREYIQNKLNYFLKIKESIAIRIILIGMVGLIISLLFYGDVILNQGFNKMYERGGGSGGVLSFNYIVDSYDIEDKTLGDFFDAPTVSKMDQEQGVGVLLFVLCLIGIIFIFFSKDPLYKKNLIYLILFLWYFIFLWILTGGYFRFSVQNYRWWSIFAIFIALHAASTIMIILKGFKNNLIKISIVLILLVGLIFTSAVPRYTVQSSQWPPGVGWSNYEEVLGYSSLRNLSFNNNIFSLCNNKGIVANNQMNFPWSKEVSQYFEYINNLSIEKDINQVRDKIIEIKEMYNISYLIISNSCVNTLGLNITNELLQNYSNSPDYMINSKLSNKAFFLFEVKK